LSSIAVEIEVRVKPRCHWSSPATVPDGVPAQPSSRSGLLPQDRPRSAWIRTGNRNLSCDESRRNPRLLLAAQSSIYRAVTWLGHLAAKPPLAAGCPCLPAHPRRQD